MNVDCWITAPLPKNYIDPNRGVAGFAEDIQPRVAFELFGVCVTDNRMCSDPFFSVQKKH